MAQSDAAGGLLRLAWAVDGLSRWRFAASDVATSTSDAATSASGLEIRAAGDDGQGVFLLHAASAGERLLAERPLLAWGGRTKEELRRAVDALGKADRAAFWALCQNAEHGVLCKTAWGVWISNALPTEDEPATAAVFRVTSRLNHSCAPNAWANWNSRTQRMTVHALGALPAGEEVRVDYRGADGETRADRRAALLTDFGFACSCSLCRLDGANREASDHRRAHIISLGERIRATPCPTDLVRIVETRLKLMAAEAPLLATAWDTYAAASDYLGCTGEPRAAAHWALRAASCAETALGRDSDEWLRYTAQARALTALTVGVRARDGNGSARAGRAKLH